MTDTNLGKWDRWYAGLTNPQPYGDSTTYQLGAEWLEGLDLIEDWGCGKGWFRTFIPDGVSYRGIDGSATPFAAEIVDLAEYRSTVPGIFMRHVLEHDYRWRAILANALASFTERMVLVLFTPLAVETHQIAWNEDPGVPDLSFRLADIETYLQMLGCTWTVEHLETATQYGVETVLRIAKP